MEDINKSEGIFYDSIIDTITGEEINLNDEFTKYINSISKNPNSAFDDLYSEIQEIKKEDFLHTCEVWKNILQNIMNADIEYISKEQINEIKKRTEETFENCYETLLSRFEIYIKAIEYYGLNLNKAYRMISKKAAKWYNPLERITANSTLAFFEKNSWVIPYSQAVLSIAQMSSKGKQSKVDPVTDTLEITKKEVQLFLDKFSELSGTLGINTHKLLITGLACFANTNQIGLTERGGKGLTPTKYRISFPEKEYALLCGYDVKEHPTSTSEEVENEKKRIKMVMDNVRKQIKKDLNILSHTRIIFSPKKQSTDFKNIAIIGTTGIQKGYIEMTFDVAFIEYILQIQALIQYPTALLLIDNRKANAYCIGLKISEHYYMLHNHETGTQNRLKVQTLLACTNLPAIEKVREQRQNWRTHMQEPLENALIELKKTRVISSWNYSENGILLTDEETENILDFETWYNLNVEYTMEKPSDLTELIEERKQKKKKHTKQKEKNDTNTPAIPKKKRGRPRKTES